MNEERFTFDKGKVSLDLEAIRADFTVCMSPEGETLHGMALEVLEKLRAMQDFLKEKGHNPELMQILEDDNPEAAWSPNTGRVVTTARCFYQRSGQLRINEHFFAEV